jgi:tyrosine-protein kinase Etk/Wzc
MASVNKQQDSATFGNYISKMWYKYFPYWPIFLLFSCVCLAGSWYHLQNQVRLYSASAKILLNDGKGDESQSKIVEDLSTATPRKSIDNQIEVMRSRSLMAEVVKNLGLYAPVFEKGRFIDRAAYESSPITVLSENPDSMMEAYQIPFKFDQGNSQVGVGNKRYPLNTWVKTDYGTLQFQLNPYFREQPKGSLYFSLVHPIDMAGRFAGSLGISALNKTSNIMYISLIDESPKRAENILNELISVYNIASINEKNRVAKNTLEFIDTRLAIVSRDLDSIEKVIKQYKSSQGAYDISAQGQMYLGSVQDLDKQVSSVNIQLDVMNQVQDYVLQKKNDGSIVPSTMGISDPMLSQMVSKLYETETNYERLKKTYGENHPQVAPLLTEINRLKPSILENIENQKKNLQLNRNELSKNSNKYSAMLSNVPQKEKDLLEISREQAIKNSVYNYLLQKREENYLSYNSTIPDGRVIEKAAGSYVPVSPNGRRTYMTALIFAFAISIVLIVGNEIFSRKILYRHEIESLTSFPIVAEIAYERSTKLIVENSGKNYFITEQFRKLRSSLTFLGISSTKRKKILVTSTIPGEGKSFIAANLGLSLALTGKKTILLELDLINPTLAQKLYMNEPKGMSNYIIGEMTLDEVIKQTNVDDNLYIISSGPLPDNPSEFLLNEKLPQLLVQLETMFDYIVIDTAPIGPITDAYVLSGYCDATLYVIRHKYTPKVIVERIDEENKINPLKNPAIVFNAVRSRGFGKSNYGYGYGYGYSYSYNYKQKNGRERLVVKKKNS